MNVAKKVLTRKLTGVLDEQLDLEAWADIQALNKFAEERSKSVLTTFSTIKMFGFIFIRKESFSDLNETKSRMS